MQFTCSLCKYMIQYLLAINRNIPNLGISKIVLVMKNIFNSPNTQTDPKKINFLLETVLKFLPLLFIKNYEV